MCISAVCNLINRPTSVSCAVALGGVLPRDTAHMRRKPRVDVCEVTCVYVTVFVCVREGVRECVCVLVNWSQFAPRTFINTATITYYSIRI